MKYLILLIISAFSLLPVLTPKEVEIEWVDGLEGDFSFTENWDYPENVARNSFGQLICENFCTEELSNMLDENMRIPDDSISKYYQLLDTTHYYHTISCDAQSYEFVGTDYIETERVGDTLRCYTLCNAGTHSSLVLNIVGDKCIPVLDLYSVTPAGEMTFPSSGGYIKIDKQHWDKGILKAEFRFTFENDNGNLPLWWEGRIYTPIAKE
ncbi:hypothetical protein [Dysgonomonas sp. 25]|uniref:hypothetical protein n=1 Tax=Dysgonomonas sp. 25 TaxID=2302933 RepID=UPI0013D06F2A|nr:hypothetical protein [Dysgonomonas sp. 25]NDV70439.1 hypothetical protein [Dysgonomonas sp. 25]